MENQQKPKSQWQLTKEGLYSKLNVTVRQLDIVIIVCTVLLIASLAYGYATRGFTVEFDSNGGTDVASQKLVDQRYATEPEEPTREGYVFDGWYISEAYVTQWNFETDPVEENMTLHAKWIAK